MSLRGPVYAVSAVFLILAGCANPDCTDEFSNPKKGKLGAGVVGMFSGCYDKRIVERQEKLDQTKKRNEELKRETAELKQRKFERKRRLTKIREEMYVFQSKVDKYKAEVNRLRVRSSADQKILEQLRTDFATLKIKIQNWNEIHRQSKSRIAGLETERDKLTKEFERLLKIYLALSQ